MRLLPFLPRVVAVMIAYALLIVVVLGLIMLAAQMLAESISNFVAGIPEIQGNLPQTLAPVSDWLNRLGFQVDLVESLKTAIADLGNNLENIAQPLSQVALASFGTIGNLMIVLFLSIFMALDKDRMVAFAVRLVPPQYAEETRLLERSVSRSFGGFLRGQGAMGILYAIVAAVTSLVFGLPYVAATTAFTGILHAIPFFGPFVSWVPVVAVALFAVPNVFIPVTGDHGGGVAGDDERRAAEAHGRFGGHPPDRRSRVDHHRGQGRGNSRRHLRHSRGGGPLELLLLLPEPGLGRLADGRAARRAKGVGAGGPTRSSHRPRRL